MKNLRTVGWFGSATVFLLAFGASVSEAQTSVEIDAVAGKPYGVGRISITLDPSECPAPLGIQGVTLQDAHGRTLYPAISGGENDPFVKDLILGLPVWQGGPVRQQARGILEGFLSANAPPQTTFYFLFTGRQPLTLTLGTVPPRSWQVVPRVDPDAHHTALDLWWETFRARPSGIFKKKPDYPPYVINYLEGLLARRLMLPIPEQGASGSWRTELEQKIGLFVGTERVLADAVRTRMVGERGLEEKAEFPLPRATRWTPLELPEVADDVKVEPIAMRVPEESLYIRFGSFANFLWFQDTLHEWGGDMRNLVALRGVDDEVSKRIEEELVIKQTTLGRMLGGTVVSDVAMVGTDLFFREGASFGLLFEARQTFLFTRELLAQRQARLDEGGVTEETVTIAGKEVSYLHSPDGRVRSYYLADEGYVLVTTSRTLMRRFIETGQTEQKESQRSLGQTDEFRHARSVFPVDRGDTVFIYFSDPFFREMAGSHYWIEMSRRLQAAADIVSVQLAQIGAEGASQPGETIDQLKTHQWLPPEFGPRPDGSRAEITSDGVVDSLRGRRGFFLPIPDVPVRKITRVEAEAYRDFLEYYHGRWGRLDPMMVGVKREAISGGIERITLDVRANPFAREHFERLSQHLGPPQKDRLAPVPGNLASFELQMTEQLLFGGLRNVGLPFDVVDGRVVPRGGIGNLLVGYLGTTGQAGILGFLDQLVGSPATQSARPAPSNVPPRRGRRGRLGNLARQLLGGGPSPAPSMAQPPSSSSFLGIHRYQDQRFTIYSFQEEILNQVAGGLYYEPAPRPAQIRLHVGDLSDAAATPTFGALAYLRTRQTSLANLRLIFSLNQQLGLPIEAGLDKAELVLNAKLICPLGGKYVCQKGADGVLRWTSTAFEEARKDASGKETVPKDHLAPPLNWFRGLDMDATMNPRDFSAHVELLMKPLK